ncbi:MAG: hypothetical protein AAB689_00040, partial [Patescibacteria group bacterium]
MRKILALAWAIGVFGMAGVALAQTALPDGVTEEQMNAAFKDLSVVYGAPVVRLDQAKAICNEEKYVTDCAQIGKKHDLFSDERTKQVDTLLTEFKGEAVEKLKQCSDAACLVEVATSIARRLNFGNPSVARAVELTPQKVGEKRTIVETAKSLGVDIEACRTMDPDTASVELLRSCARLAKNENIQKYIPQETKNRAEEADAAIALKEGLASGRVSCGDNTLEGCGNFCLAPSAEARAKGVAAIPPVCRQIATQFFGANGTKELERAYTEVQKTFDTLSDRAQNIAFTTADGRTLSDPASIGRYMEEAGSRGDVEAISRGMDFFMAKGFVTEQDRDFAIEMVKKVKERGSVDFGACRADPSLCADLISEKDRGQFTVMGEIEKIMRSEMEKRGVSDPSRCSVDPLAGQSCLEAARAALPQIEKLAEESPQAQAIISDIRQKIRFGEAGLEARSKVEERFRTAGDFSIGNERFSSVSELEAFCRTNSQQCLTETARDGIFSKDVAAEKYERAIKNNYNLNQGNVPNTIRTPGDFNKEEALQQFKQWLDNPQGPPPVPPGMNNRQYSPYPQYPNQYSQYPQPTDQRSCQFSTTAPTPCKDGEYRQESFNEFGCPVFGSCISFDTRTEPPQPDGKNICPALPTVESCPAGEAKEVSFSSPECGTYYSCRPSNVVQPSTPCGSGQYWNGSACVT